MESDTAHAICTLILNDIHKGRTYTKEDGLFFVYERLLYYYKKCEENSGEIDLIQKLIYDKEFREAWLGYENLAKRVLV